MVLTALKIKPLLPGRWEVRTSFGFTAPLGTDTRLMNRISSTKDVS